MPKTILMRTENVNEKFRELLKVYNNLFLTNFSIQTCSRRAPVQPKKLIKNIMKPAKSRRIDGFRKKSMACKTGRKSFEYK